MLRMPILTKSLRMRSLKSLIERKCINSRLLSTIGSASVKTSEPNYKKGDIIHGFKVEDVTSIDEIFIKSVKLTHQKTNAEYLHLHREDSNNLFSIGFRTTPTDSTGVPHILEHLTLCGSEKYPCRDPFFKMLYRSMATLMNAFTGPDYTVYPFSTQNQKDFKNLQSVYLDLVFNSRLRKIDFWQEGWRLEHTDPNDKSTPIIFKGVVFNEMKGVFNDNQYILMYGVMNNILPSHTYSVISGGNPIDIPNLTYENLLKFYQTYYHPSNARFFSYGNFPMEEHLKFLNDNYLSVIDKIDVSSTKVPSEPRWKEPKKMHFTCKFDPLVTNPEKQSVITINHLCTNVDDIDTSFDLAILSQLLLKGPNSAFYKSLVDTNIGSGFATLTGYSTYTKDTLFSVGLQEIRTEDFDKVERIYNETLQRVMQEGFNKNQIEAVLHNLELDIKTQSSNFGLHLLYSITPLWNHNGDVIKSLKINDSIAKFRKKLEQNPRYLQELVEKYLINNNHKLIATMSPDKDYEAKLLAKEKQLLESKLSELSQEEKDQIFENGQMLMKDQENTDDSVLPMLKLEDLKADVDRYTFDNLTIDSVPVQVSIQPTNGVCYYRSILNTRHLPENLKLYLPIFNDVLTEMGTKNYDYRQFDELVHLKTGGLAVNNHIAMQKDNLLSYEEGVILFSYCLSQNAEEMWKLWEELFNRFSLSDVQRFETLVKMGVANLLNSINYSGHVYAMSSAASIISPVSKFKESLSGMEHINRMKALVQMNDFSSLLDKVREIAHNILNKEHMRSAIHVSDNQEQIVKLMHSYHSSLNGSAESTKIITNAKAVEPIQKSIHHVLPYNVNHTSKAILTVPYVHDDFPVLLVLAKLVSSQYLHSEIRERGSAYGGGARVSTDGIFSFYSYRDPNSTRTFDIFDQTYDFLSKHNITEKELTEAKLSVFQQLDAPVAPHNRALEYFLHGLTYDDLQRTRLRVKQTSSDDIMKMANKYLKEDAVVGRTLIGPVDNDLKNRLSQNWHILEQEDEKMTARN